MLTLLTWEWDLCCCRRGEWQANTEYLKLQAALAQIIVKQYGRKVTPDLQSWGFDVAARIAKPAKQEAALENSDTPQ